VRRGVPGALLVLLLATGCGLPLTDGTRAAGAVADERGRPAGIKVLPPGPQPGASAEDLVRGFLRAQTSPDDDHAVARQFLLTDDVWDDDALVVIYQAGSQTVRADPSRPDLVELRLQPTAQISADGSYRLAPVEPPGPEVYQVRRRPDGELRLAQVPPGLRLQSADLSRSFVARDVFFLGRASAGMATARLVPDRVFLPVTVEPARALVQALLDGASGSLAGAVQSASPQGTELLDLRVTDDGQVSVDLSEQVEALSQRDRQRLSAQLVWTLREFSGVRLLVRGRPLAVEAVEAVQTVEDWATYDPAGVRDTVSLYYVQDRRLRTLDELPGAGDATTGVVPVDEAAVDLAESQLAVLTVGPGSDAVRIGPLTGALGAPVFRRPLLSSLSWGSGDRGLWLLEGGTTPRVWLLPGAGAPVGARPIPVAVPAPPGAGLLTRLEVSRDGARIALVFGEGPARRLYVGQVEPTTTGVVVDAVVPVAPQLADVTDVVWESGASLVVLARDAGESGLLTLRVAVDGSSSAPLLRQGVEGTPLALAAAPDRRLVVSAGAAGQEPRLFRDDGQVFRREALGRAPFYPG